MSLVQLLQPRLCLRIARNSSYSANGLSRFYSSSSRAPQVIFSGIQPTGVPHLGNYLGALQRWVELQNTSSQEDTLLFSLVDLHALTTSQDPRQLSELRKQSLAALLAVGLDPNRCILFYQSDIPQHAELMWILSCHASVGYLSRMTQWKSKLSLPDTANPFDPSPTSKDAPALRLGLFSYPVLQAADILLYNATHVPVGADQAQHLEFARELANSFNHIYGPVFKEPQTVLSPSKRVMSLREPEKKMSKSDANQKSRILITDSDKVIETKIRAAQTDTKGSITYDPDGRPGVANLLQILLHTEADAPPTVEELAKDCENLTFPQFKSRIADAITKKITPIREKYEFIMGKDHMALSQATKLGQAKAKNAARDTMDRVKAAVGLY